MKRELTDIHQHLIWGMDDGADSRETMFSMLREAHHQGIKTVVATPHASALVDFPTPEGPVKATAKPSSSIQAAWRETILL